MMTKFELFITESGEVPMTETDGNRSKSGTGHGAERMVTTLFLSALFLLMPIALRNGFRDIKATKLIVFYSLATAYLLALLVLWIVRRARRQSADGNKLVFSDVFFLVFAAVGILSSIVSGFGRQALMANDNRHQGILTFLLYAALLLSLRRYGCFSTTLRHAVLLSFSLVCGLGILNQLHIDPLGYSEALVSPHEGQFTSTIGNIIFYGAYCVLLFPIPLYHLLHAERKRELFFYAGLTVLGTLGVMAARTESALLGMLTVAAVMPLLCLDVRALKRWLWVFPALLIVMKLYAVTVLALGGFSLAILMKKILNSPVVWIACAVFLTCALLTRGSGTDAMLRFRRRYGKLLAVAVVLGLAALVMINLRFADIVPDSIAKYAVITPSWGTDRGKIWASMLLLQERFSPLERLIGGGSGCICRWDIMHPLFSDAITDAAHNEYLHYLLTHGVIGLVSYLLFLFSSVRRSIRSEVSESRAYLCGCIAYAVQASVSIAQPFTTPLFLCLMFLLPTPMIRFRECGLRAHTAPDNNKNHLEEDRNEEKNLCPTDRGGNAVDDGGLLHKTGRRADRAIDSR